jgi:hypothetical protein
MLASAAGLPDPDLQVPYAQADLALSSVSYWYDYEYSGAMNLALEERYAERADRAMAYSIFSRHSAVTLADRRRRGRDRVRRGRGGQWFLGGAGPVGWKVLAGACPIWGIGGSAAT